MLGIAYAASLGGMGTPIGTPTNAIFIGHYQSTYGQTISMPYWMSFAMPLVILLTLGTWWFLAYPGFKLARNLPIQLDLRQSYRLLGSVKKEEVAVLLMFFAVAVGWLFSPLIKQYALPGINDAVIALAGAALLFILPAPNHKGHQLMDWATAERIPWGVLLLFGGGLALAEGFKLTGLAGWLGQQLAGLSALPLLLMLGLILAMIVLLSEIASNVATASMMMPILSALAATLKLEPFGLLFGAVLASSCGFMLPVATAPNAIAYASGYLNTRDMARAGIFLDVLAILLITGFIYLLAQ
jgi:sodium-dependent dicarboxylate transporter 2/3/5